MMYEEWIYTAKARDVHTFRYGDSFTDGSIRHAGP